MPAAWPPEREVSFLLIQAEAASRLGLTQVLGRYMNPDDLKFLEKYRRRDSKDLEKSSENSYSFFGELFVQAIFYGAGIAFFWFISQKWSWI